MCVLLQMSTPPIYSYFRFQPDLPLRLKKDLPLTEYDRSKFYVTGSTEGYADYPYAAENAKELGADASKIDL